jgi:hypothetical protein
MRFAAAATLIVGAVALSACNRGEKAQQQNPQQKAGPAAQAKVTDQGLTPMDQRVAVIGLLNKRNGIVRDLALRPGQAARAKDVIIRLRACETTAPWEEEKLTGAFIQVDVRLPDNRWNRVFSGWLYKESPSLNVVEHPVYDVWVKSCAMNFPAGSPAPAAPSASSNASRPKKSGDGAAAAPSESDEPAAETPPTAADSNSA